MKDLPNSFVAACLVLIGSILGVICLFAPLRENVTMAVVTMASSIITGAFGYIQGRKESTGGVSVTATAPDAPTASGASATATVGDKPNTTNVTT